ncbi:endonuclease/exonuclease/phosphatase family protein [Halomonas nitroreducens]|uniref:Endonuclease n=1 Tax=Halomonas nitroreducens TaxID=447425 RepID=A0A3S0R2J0_9GAMM|nr:endonuclease/exonuclease/phosphatase family protein [Halomonas nitroreducens]RTR05217.1 endonuclease [Halomonas nitroreducens]
MPRLVMAAVLVVLSLSARADAVVGSWNIEHLGWNNGKRVDLVARVADRFDLLAVQELMDPAALGQLEQALEAASGEPWSAMASHALGRGRYREHYGFLWREAEVEYLDGAVVFLDHGDVFAREPYSARFRDRESGEAFVAASVHVVYGDGTDDRLPEIAALADYWRWLAEAHPDTPRLLMGDFNLPPDHPAWAPLRALGAVPAITDQATTLSEADGRYASRYDNIWYRPDRLSPADLGVVRYPALVGLGHHRARKRVSDHAPVYLALHGGRLASLAGQDDAAVMAGHCIDLNASSPAALQGLPHVGPARAAAIVAGRPWHDATELTRIRGIAEARLDEIRGSGRLCDR